VEKDSEDVNKIFELMCQLFLLPNKCRKPGRLHSEDGEVENNDICIESLPGLHNHGFQTIRDKFLGLSTDSKICFLRFVVLPENQEVNQMMLFIGVFQTPRCCERHSRRVHGKYFIEPVEN
ncbi:unnamed protein product, partial [Brassica oleracea var. botrytis]